jgi:hypothetical protein
MDFGFSSRAVELQPGVDRKDTIPQGYLAMCGGEQTGGKWDAKAEAGNQ